MPPVGFEPTIAAGEQPQTNTLDCAAAGTSSLICIGWKFIEEYGPNVVNFMKKWEYFLFFIKNGY